MGFGDFLRLLLIFVTYFLAWQIGRWIVLPHLQIFPYIPPNSVWEAAYSVALSGATYVFWFAVLLVVFLYVVYVFVDKVLRYIPPLVGEIVAEFLLNITPLKDLRELGLYDLVNNIVGIIFSRKSLKDRILDAVRAIFEFLLIATGIEKNVSTIRSKVLGSNTEPEDIKIEVEYDNEDKEEKNITKKQNTNIKKDNKYKNISPPHDIGGTTDEERLVQSNYEKCYLENIVPVTDDMSALERLKLSYMNSIKSSKCNIQLIKDKSNIDSMKQK
jgi:hypothetical protein